MTRGHRTALSPSPRATSLCTLMPCTAHTCAHAYCGACRGRGRLLPGQAPRCAPPHVQARTRRLGARHGRGRTPVAPSGAQRAPPAQGPGSSAHLRGGPVRSTHRAPRAAQRLQRSCARGRACGSDAVRAPHGAGGRGGCPGGAAPVLLCWGRGAARRISRAPPRLTEANSSRRQWRVPADRGLRARTPGRMGARGPLADVFFLFAVEPLSVLSPASAPPPPRRGAPWGGSPSPLKVSE
uniref:ICP0-like protein n=1 Tax=Gallid alphaherpesvirus 2 TaxID=10390 RepID=D2Y5U3_9ALPH|nr:ICP0-like protein [Gallid alphaherpesvirus 2]